MYVCVCGGFIQIPMRLPICRIASWPRVSEIYFLLFPGYRRQTAHCPFFEQEIFRFSRLTPAHYVNLSQAELKNVCAL